MTTKPIYSINTRLKKRILCIQNILKESILEQLIKRFFEFKPERGKHDHLSIYLFHFRIQIKIIIDTLYFRLKNQVLEDRRLLWYPESSGGNTHWPIALHVSRHASVRAWNWYTVQFHNGPKCNLSSMLHYTYLQY